MLKSFKAFVISSFQCINNIIKIIKKYDNFHFNYNRRNPVKIIPIASKASLKYDSQLHAAVRAIH